MIICRQLDLVILDIKSGDPETYRRVTRRGSGTDAAIRRTARGDEQAGVGSLHARAGIDRRLRPMSEAVAKFVAPMKNVEWVEVLPFHQLGAFKWKALALDYTLAETPPASPELVARVVGQFRDAGCRAR